MQQDRFITLACSLILSAMIFFPPASNAGLPGPPAPPLVLPAPPPVFHIPGTYAYFAPDVDAELFFYDGHWYRHHEGGWYRSSRYSGPWGFIAAKRVPGVLINLKPEYRNVPPGQRRIPYIQLKKNWKTWQRHKHWDKPRKPGKRKTGGTKIHKESEHGPDKKGHGK